MGFRVTFLRLSLTDGSDFQLVRRAGDPGDIEITGEQTFILTTQQEATVAISGDPWTNITAPAAPVTLRGIEVSDTTPVLALRGAVIDEESGHPCDRLARDR